MKLEDIDMEAAERYEVTEIKKLLFCFIYSGITFPEYDFSNTEYDKLEYEKRLMYEKENMTTEELYNTDMLEFSKTINMTEAKDLCADYHGLSFLPHFLSDEKRKIEEKEYKKVQKIIRTYQRRYPEIPDEEYQNAGIDIAAANLYEDILFDISSDGEIWDSDKSKSDKRYSDYIHNEFNKKQEYKLERGFGGKELYDNWKQETKKFLLSMQQNENG